MQTVTLIEVIAAARARKASLVPESAGYFMMALGRAMAGLPLRADPSLVLLSTEGVVTFAGPRTKLPAHQAAEEMRMLLAALLEVSQGLPGALEAAFDPPDAGVHPLTAFFAAVTRALIPINREAAKRALARLARETLRAIEVGGLVVKPLAPPEPQADEPEEPQPDEQEPEELDEEPEDEQEPEALGEEEEEDEDDFEEEFDVDIETPTPSPVVASIELLTPTPPGRDATPSPVVATLETLELTPATPTVVDVVVNGPDATPSAWQETKPYAFDVRDHQVALGPVSPSSIRFEPDEIDIDAAIEAVRRLSPVDAVPVAAPVVITPTPVPEHAPPSDPTPPPPEPPTDLEVLERLKHAAHERALARRKAHARAARKRSKVRASVVAEKAAPELDRLLARFSGEHDGDAVAEAAKGLQRMVSLDLTPRPNDVTPTGLSRDSESGPVALSPNAPCRTPADTLGDVEEERTIPPALVTRQGRSMKRPLMFSAALLVAGVCSAGIVQLRRHQLAATAPVEAAVGAKENCLADIELTGLPTPHEILVRLGEAPLRTRALPTGVRLELVALAPEHRALRLIVPADADWKDVMSTRVLRLDAKLERGGLQPWPTAPAGEVGGVGPSGVIDIESDPKSAELWLVVGAGDTSSTRVTLDCESEARLLVVATSDPITQRRLHVPVELLRAAAESGAAQVSVGM